MRTKRAQSETSEVTTKKKKQTPQDENQENEDPKTIPYSQYQALKSKYESLKNLRETEAEKLYTSLKKSADEREEVSELESFKKGHDERLDSLLNLIHFYEEMTSIKITPVENSKFECLLKNTKTNKEFMFELAVVEGEIEYTPITGDAFANLPDLFTDTICFSVQELPVFISKLLTHMYK